MLTGLTRVVRVLPQRLPATSPCARTRCAPRTATTSSTSSARSTAASSGVAAEAGVRVAGRQRRQHQRRHEAQLQRLRPRLQRAHAAAASAPSAASTSSARSTTCACRRPSDPNRSLYCNQADSGIPWQKQFKATVVYPLPWYGHLGQRGVSEPERLPVGHRGAGLRRLHRRHRLRPSERPRHVLAGDADDALCGQLHGRVHAGRAGAAGAGRQRPGDRSACRWSRRRRSSRRASTSSTSRSSKRFEFGAIRVTAEAGHVQRAQLGRLHRRWRRAQFGARDLHAAVGRFCRAASSASARTCAGRSTVPGCR